MWARITTASTRSSCAFDQRTQRTGTRGASKFQALRSLKRNIHIGFIDRGALCHTATHQYIHHLGSGSAIDLQVRLAVARGYLHHLQLWAGFAGLAPPHNSLHTGSTSLIAHRDDGAIGGVVDTVVRRALAQHGVVFALERVVLHHLQRAQTQ